jgi:diguanylate cyclase (GGDEF)-like protein
MTRIRYTDSAAGQAVVLGEVLAAHGAAMQQAQSALEMSATLLERANLTDDLTGVGNRRRANSLLDMMQPGDGLALLDLDHFKTVNDSLGHAEGDRVLMALGAYLLDSLRDADCVARFGGEEFLILLRGAGQEAGAVIERLLDGWRLSGATVTLSAGVAVHVDGRSPALTLRQADTLLYAAKAAGRDQVLVEWAAQAAMIGG